MNRFARMKSLAVYWLVLSVLLTSAGFGATKKSSSSSAGKSKQATSTSAKPTSKSSAKSSSSSSQKTPVQSANSVEEFVDRAESLLRQQSKSLRIGVCVTRVDTGETVFAHDADELLIPASNRKLFVTALALHHLGPDHRFSTPLYLSRRPDGPGTFTGDLIVRGSGDPTFLNLRFGNTPYSVFRQWAESLAENGIKSIEGNLIMDSSGFATGDQVADGWTERYETASYAPRPSGICLQSNIMELRIRPGSVGKPAVVVAYPANSTVHIDNRTETRAGRTRDSIAVQRSSDGMDHLIVRGRLGASAGQQGLRVPLEQPDRVAGEVLLSTLEKRGISVSGSVQARNGDKSSSPAGWIKIAEYMSPPLGEIMAITNKKSDNHCAEQIFQAVTFAKTGTTSYAKAKRFEDDFLAESGILPSECNFEDGCGLSRLNLVTPRAVVKLLTFMAQHPYAATFRDSLAVAGRDGTLRGRLGGSSGRVFAKTGSIAVSACLSGYAETKSGVPIAFSILANNPSGHLSQARYVQDRLCEMIVNTNF